mmetsp:Transcript_46463/g.143968  ORF Transcript_46463/g.143968 Transcript_46463/m.143968 type:complete len:381 (-) Transcript_46463:134-1276(-)
MAGGERGTSPPAAAARLVPAAREAGDLGPACPETCAVVPRRPWGEAAAPTAACMVPRLGDRAVLAPLLPLQARLVSAAGSAAALAANLAAASAERPGCLAGAAMPRAFSITNLGLGVRASAAQAPPALLRISGVDMECAKLPCVSTGRCGSTASENSEGRTDGLLGEGSLSTTMAGAWGSAGHAKDAGTSRTEGRLTRSPVPSHFMEDMDRRVPSGSGDSTEIAPGDTASLGPGDGGAATRTLVLGSAGPCSEVVTEAPERLTSTAGAATPEDPLGVCGRARGSAETRTASAAFAACDTVQVATSDRSGAVPVATSVSSCAMETEMENARETGASGRLCKRGVAAGEAGDGVATAGTRLLAALESCRWTICAAVGGTSSG